MFLSARALRVFFAGSHAHHSFKVAHQVHEAAHLDRDRLVVTPAQDVLAKLWGVCEDERSAASLIADIDELVVESL